MAVVMAEEVEAVVLITEVVAIITTTNSTRGNNTTGMVDPTATQIHIRQLLPGVPRAIGMAIIRTILTQTVKLKEALPDPLIATNLDLMLNPALENPRSRQRGRLHRVVMNSAN